MTVHFLILLSFHCRASLSKKYNTASQHKTTNLHPTVVYSVW